MNILSINLPNSAYIVHKTFGVCIIELHMTSSAIQYQTICTWIMDKTGRETIFRR